jgi:hypothetical protein
MTERLAGHMSLRSWFDEESQQACFEISEAGETRAHMTLELPEFRTLLRHLGQLRTRFSEPVTHSLEPRARLDLNPLAAYSVIDGQAEGERVLMVRHPGYGWLAFGISAKGCQRIAVDLLRETQGRQHL